MTDVPYILTDRFMSPPIICNPIYDRAIRPTCQGFAVIQFLFLATIPRYINNAVKNAVSTLHGKSNGHLVNTIVIIA